MKPSLQTRLDRKYTMPTQNTIDHTCGGLLIALTVVAAAVNGSPFETYDKSFDEALQKVADNPGLFKASLVGVALATAMYLVYRGHDRPVSLLGAKGYVPKEADPDELRRGNPLSSRSDKCPLPL